MNITIVTTSELLGRCFANAVAHARQYMPPLVWMPVFVGPLDKYTGFAEKPAVVTPTNSAAFMGAGFDKAVLDVLAVDEKDIQGHVLEENCSFLTPTAVLSVKLHNSKASHLLLVSTMAVPERIEAEQVFYSMWNILLKSRDLQLRHVVVPALGAGYGGVAESQVARFMVGAVCLFFHEFELPLARSASVFKLLGKNQANFGKSTAAVLRNAGRVLDLSEL